MVQCETEDFFRDDPSTITILTSIAGVLLTLLIESAAHSSIKDPKDLEAPKADAEPSATTTVDAQAEESNVAPQIKMPDAETDESTTFDPLPPTFRANKLLAVTILLVPATVCFVFRLLETQCGVNWVALSIVNILPYTCSCIAWLRTLVDCLLVRDNRTLSSGVWPPFYPIGIVCILFRDMVFHAMGRPDLAVFKKASTVEEVELSERQQSQPEDEEQIGLIQGFHDETRHADDEMTMYSPRSSIERKGDDMV